MTPEQFAYWLQGYSEVTGTRPTTKQWQVIKDNIKLVFDEQATDDDEDWPPYPYDSGKKWPTSPQFIC